MEPGFYTGISDTDYHAGPGVNKSTLDRMAVSPLHALHSLTNDKSPPETVAYFIGKALHALVLEPEKFADSYVCELTKADAPNAIADREELVARIEAMNETRLPKLPLTGSKDELWLRIVNAYEEMQPKTAATPEELADMKAADLKAEIERLNKSRPGKLKTSGSMRELADIITAETGEQITLWSEVRDRWNAENEGHIVLSEKQWEIVQQMAASIRLHPVAGRLLTPGSGVAESSVYWIDKTTGELCRCRPDFWRYNGILVDLKTTVNASKAEFARSVSKYRYHVQDPWYTRGAQEAFDNQWLTGRWERPKAFVFVVVEKSAPYAVACYMLDPDSRYIGEILMDGNLQTLAECKASGEFPGYSNGGIETLSLPEWEIHKNAHLLSGGE